MREINFAICVDQLETAEMFTTMVKDALIKRGQSFFVKSYQLGTELLEDSNKYDVVFLDIEMPQIDGIEVGKKLRELVPECKIIMATGKPERFKEAFLFQAYRFITKPFSREELEETISSICCSFSKNARLDVFWDREAVTIFTGDISYIEAINGYCEIHAGNKIFQKKVTVSEMEDILDSRFFYRVSRQFIVNLEKICCYNEGVIMMEDGRIYVSRRRKSSFLQKYIDFDLHYRGMRLL